MGLVGDPNPEPLLEPDPELEPKPDPELEPNPDPLFEPNPPVPLPELNPVPLEPFMPVAGVAPFILPPAAPPPATSRVIWLGSKTNSHSL